MFQDEGMKLVLGLVIGVVIVAVIVFLAKSSKEVGSQTADSAKTSIDKTFTDAASIAGS